MVHACAALLKEHQEELAKLIALETGKALRTESRVEAGVVADVFEFFGGLGSELKGESVPFAPNVLSVTVREQKVYSSAPDGAVAYTSPSGTAAKGTLISIYVSNGQPEPPKSEDDGGDKKKDDTKDKKKDRGASRGND